LCSQSLPLAFAVTQQLWPAKSELAANIRATPHANPVRDLTNFIVFLS
jgi:hypothetical protein